MRKNIAFWTCVVVGFLMAAAFLCQMANPAPAVAAIPTPVAEVAGGGDWVMTTYTSASTWNNFTTTQTSPTQHAPAYTAADITWTVDVSGTITGTCTIQFSNDNANWASGVQMFSVAADATNIDQFNLFGRYHRVTCTENSSDNANTITMTIMGKLIN